MHRIPLEKVSTSLQPSLVAAVMGSLAPEPDVRPAGGRAFIRTLKKAPRKTVSPGATKSDPPLYTSDPQKFTQSVEIAVSRVRAMELRWNASGHRYWDPFFVSGEIPRGVLSQVGGRFTLVQRFGNEHFESVYTITQTELPERITHCSETPMKKVEVHEYYRALASDRMQWTAAYTIQYTSMWKRFKTYLGSGLFGFDGGISDPVEKEFQGRMQRFKAYAEAVQAGRTEFAQCGTCGGKGQVFQKQLFVKITTACPSCTGRGWS